MRYFPRALRYLAPYWKLAIALMVLLVLGVLVTLLSPWPFKYIVDNVLKDEPLPGYLHRVTGMVAGNRFGLLVLFVAAGFVLVLIQNAFAVLSSYVSTKIDQNMTLDFRSQMFRHIESLSMATHDQRRSGMLIYCINSMCDGVPRLIMAVPPLVQSALTLIGMFCVTFFINAQLAIVSTFIAPMLYFWITYYVKRIQPRLWEVKMLEGESLAIVHEAISMIRVIAAFCREYHEYSRFHSQAERAVNARIHLTVRQTLFTLAVESTTALGTALVLGFGSYEVLRGKLELGDLLVVLSYVAAVYKPLDAISAAIGSLQDVFINLKIAFGLLDTAADIRDEPDAIDLPQVRGEVTYKNVGFSYSGRSDTLKNISFQAQPGQVIAIVGATGAGKTTLVSLLPRFYDSSCGQILIDGIDIRKLTLRSLRRHISIVLQEPLLFSGTIRDNIRYGDLNASTEQIVGAAQAANAHDFITRLPQGYETELGERGAKLSGGERQRIAVARAFIKNAPILILDEPTSSIDSKTEAVILDALDRLMEGRTTFMIAHRLSTIRRADCILVVDQGELVELGTHDELLALGRIYKQLYDMQTAYVRVAHS